MADPTSLGGCDEKLPLLPIMRQFDFGQFVFLHDKPKVRPTPGQRGSRPIVVDPSGGRAQALQDWHDRTKNGAQTLQGRPPDTDLLGGVSLDKLFAPRDELSPLEIKVTSATLGEVIGKAQINHEGKTYSLEVSSAAADSLARGQSTLVLAAVADEPARQFMTQLTPDLSEHALDSSAIDGLLALGTLDYNGVSEQVTVDAALSHSLLAGRPVSAWTNGASKLLLRLVPSVAARRPAATSVVIGDLSTFLGQPQIEGADGLPLALKLEATHVRELRTAGFTTIAVAGTAVTVRDSRFGLSAAPRLADINFAPASGPNLRAAAAAEEVVAANPLGLRVAVFMPWRQTWKLMGFSRGELRSSLALAPQEETTIEVSSWERRLRTLDQSSQTDVEQSFESSTTETATDDVFDEMTNQHDFNWQVGGSLDATYSTGTGSISVAAGGQVDDATQLQSIARSTQQSMKESTQKAAARIRAVRTTHITDSIEEGSQTRVTRRIKNPNFSHTLTLDFFETLAHYEVTLEAVPARLALVALLDNPMSLTEFTPSLVRSNETVLRRALLDSSLNAGFDACRKTSAYKKAIDIINEQALMGATTDNATDKGTGKRTQESPLPSAQERAVVDLLRQTVAAYARVSRNKLGSAPPSQLPAMQSIKDGNPVSADDRIDAQHTLFLQLCSKFLPAVLGAIKNVPANPTIADAGPLANVIPPPGAPMSLLKFSDVSFKDKEDAGMGNAISQAFGTGTMGWANGQCLANNLYTPDDAGLAGLADTLWTAYKAYLAKQSEGDFTQAKEDAIKDANANQEKLSTADKLAMAFPLDELASAREREEALLEHLKAHADHYRFALFQGLSPAEQSKYIEASGLAVGTFEPRVLAISGPQLAVPLAPPPAGDLRTLLEGLRKSFTDAFSLTVDNPDTFIFPTPGMTINSRLGACTACEDFIEDSRTIELRRLAAVADSAEHEATRRAKRLEAKEFGDPDIENAPLRVMLEQVV